ncbi:uncharacterized protein [Linepithema humile]|uniref:uncharacterized protein isoform X3 n=1 Tax=Linepithema humile TaxID=83485 RepID=UPI00351F2099
MDGPAFAVLKFARENDKSDEEEINYEIGLTKWLTDIDDELKDFTYWPLSDQDVGNFVKKEKAVDRSWPKYSIEVLRYYDLYIKVRAAVRGFVAEGSAYETEKETGRGKRKGVQNRLFEDTDSDEEIVNRSKKSVLAPPSVPFKHVPVRKEIIQKTGNELNYCLFPVTSFPPSKACSKGSVFERLKRTQEVNNNINNASVSHTMLIAHESNYSSNGKSFRKNIVQLPIKETSLVTAENTLSQSCVSSLDVDEENLTYGEQNETPNKKRQTNYKCEDTMQHVPSSSVVFHDSPVQTRRFSPLKSGFHQRVLFTSPAKNSDVEDKISKVEKLCEKIYVRLEEINKKTDKIIMNQERLNKSLLVRLFQFFYHIQGCSQIYCQNCCKSSYKLYGIHNEF